MPKPFLVRLIPPPFPPLSPPIQCLPGSTMRGATANICWCVVSEKWLLFLELPETNLVGLFEVAGKLTLARTGVCPSFYSSFGLLSVCQRIMSESWMTRRSCCLVPLLFQGIPPMRT
jgi:hypothetical protein